MTTMDGPSDSAKWLPGNLGGAWLNGDRVHRTTGPWTPAVHSLLQHLAQRQGPCVPRVLGLDGQGREMLTYLPGRVVDIDSEILTATQLQAIASWTRTFHEAVRDFTHPGPWRHPPVPKANLVGHNDIAPYNVCFDGDELVGVFDWDLAGRSTPIAELAFIAWNCVPLWRDIGLDDTVERLSLICQSYGDVSPRDVLRGVPDRVQVMLDWIPQGAAAGDLGLRRLMALGEPRRSQAALARLVPRLARMHEALQAVATQTGRPD